MRVFMHECMVSHACVNVLAPACVCARMCTHMSESCCRGGRAVFMKTDVKS